jgi:hypothetical protein
MQLRSPDLSLEQISAWMRLAAPKEKSGATAARAVTVSTTSRHHPGFDFKSARQSLKRARAKNDIDTIKPLRRLRRNQGAINEALIDALSAALAVNKQMASEITALSTDLSAVRARLADNEVAPPSGEHLDSNL